MAKSKRKKKKKNLKRKRIVSGVLIALFLVIASGLFYINSNFNKLISSKIHTLYNQSEAAHYYKLSFDKLRVNIISQNVRVYNVSFEPKTEQQAAFFKENGSVDIRFGKIIIKNASIFDFLSNNDISIKEFKVKDSKITTYETAENFHPFAFIKKKENNDSLQIQIAVQNINIDKAELLYYKNNIAKVENSFDNFNMEVKELLLIKDKSFTFSFESLMASLNDISYRGIKGSFISMHQFQIGASNFMSHNKEGIFEFDFKDLAFHISNPQFITADSVYTISANRLTIDKQSKQLLIYNAVVYPNLSEKEFMQHYKYQKLRPELKVQYIRLSNINFDKLVDNKGLFADSLIVSGTQAELYKSKFKPINSRRFPNYLALQFKSIKYPLKIKVVKAEDVNIDFTLQHEDGHLSHVVVNKLQGKLKNVQNKNSKQNLYLSASGSLENSIPFSVKLVFSYSRDYFTYKGQIFKSNLTSVSKMINSFAPVQIKSGIIKSLKFQGIVNRTDSRGVMTFVYNDLKLIIDNNELEKKKRFGNHIISFAANTYLLSNNPTAMNMPPREVRFFARRDMNKGFIHILVQSVLSGVKETVVPSRENRQRYKQVKRKKKTKSSY